MLADRPDIAAFQALAAATAPTPGLNGSWRVARAPQGHIRPDDFAWVESPIPQPGPGEVLLKTLYLGLAPVMRMYMSGMGVAGEAPLKPGDVIHGRGVAQVVQSRHKDWPEGTVVQGQLGWQQYKVSAMTPAEKFRRCRNFGLPAQLHCKVLGMTGLSAWAGLYFVAPTAPDDAMLVSGAAGGVGHLVLQLASHDVGGPVVGVAGGAEKCALVRALGASAAIDYQAGDFAGQLAAHFPHGIDHYFDNVGGAMLAAVLDRLAPRARIVLCGSISEYADGAFPLTNYTRLRSTDASMHGFFVYNHLHRWDEMMDAMAAHIKAGTVRPVEDVTPGIQAMPLGLARLYTGGNRGTALCQVAGEPKEWR